MTGKEGGLPGGESEMFKELELQVSSLCRFKVAPYIIKLRLSF